MKHAALLCLLLALTAFPAIGDIVEFSDGEVAIKTRDASYTEEKIEGEDAVKAQFEPTELWSFVRFAPAAGSWDLSKYTGVSIEITNTGSMELKPGFRADEAGKVGKDAWNATHASVAPGETKTLFVKFGMDYNKPKEIDTTKIGAIQVFLGKNRAEASTLILRHIKAVE